MSFYVFDSDEVRSLVAERAIGPVCEWRCACPSHDCKTVVWYARVENPDPSRGLPAFGFSTNVCFSEKDKIMLVIIENVEDFETFLCNERASVKSRLFYEVIFAQGLREIILSAESSS